MDRLKRNMTIVGGSYLVSLLIAGVLQFAVWADRMPDPMASHFGSGRNADGFMDATGLYLVFAASFVLAGGLFCAVLWHTGRQGAQRQVVAFGSGLAVNLFVLLLALQVANLDLADATEATLPLTWLLSSFAAAIGAGVLGWFMAGPDEVSQAGGNRGHVPDARELAEGEVVAWHRTVGSPVVGALGAVTVLAALPLQIVAGWVPALVMVLGGLLCGLFALVMITVNRDGLTIKFMGLPWPRKVISLDAMTEASHREVAAMSEFGGWGYRITAERAGVILRSGEALTVRLKNGKEFAVTTKDSESAASLLNGLIGQNGTGGSSR